ncbi:DNA polymerase III chi subunit [hydrothermal vent metagenome]|uniref:DNA polymerase III chi subunit n=1 Tax=hydrothermal vent metagenome TaxID=652676 RepID=A0A3B0S0M8_9ZZZZ
MQVDFYHLTRDPAEKLAPMLASKSLDAGNRVLLVSQDEALCAALSDALWQQGATSFLAHDFAGSDNESAQPILISDQCQAANNAKYIVLTDGEWRDETLGFERAFFLFTPQHIDEARTAWRMLSAMEDVTPRYWKQDGGRWVEGP